MRLSEVCQTKKDKYHMVLLMWNLKTKQTNKNRLRSRDQRDGYQKGGIRRVGEHGRGHSQQYCGVHTVTDNSWNWWGVHHTARYQNVES